MIEKDKYPNLARFCYSCPAIDNHAHNIVKRSDLNGIPPLECIYTEAEDKTLIETSELSLVSIRTINQLSQLYDCEPKWIKIKNKINNEISMKERCERCFERSGIVSVLFDDLIKGSKEFCNDYLWHSSFLKYKPKRLIRLEIIIEEVILCMFGFDSDHQQNEINMETLIDLRDRFLTRVVGFIEDSEVVGFKSISCYRGGLDIHPSITADEALGGLIELVTGSGEQLTLGHLRIDETTKALNDWLLLAALAKISNTPRADRGIVPIQFHVGLGDQSVRLKTARPCFLQNLIEHFPSVPIILLHACYPYTAEAGYMASVFSNVYLDFGEIFPAISRAGQERVMEEMLEICPASKLLWSTDGRTHVSLCFVKLNWSKAEGFYLASLQSREALYQVLGKYIERNDLNEDQATQIVYKCLFENSNKLYHLNYDDPLNLF